MIERELNVRGRRLRFLIYSDDTSPDGRLADITRVLARIPNAHLFCIPPVLIMQHKPGGADGGGYWPGGLWRTTFSGAAHERSTGVPFADLAERLGPHVGSLIGMSRDRWTGSHPTSTFMHEVGHAVHAEFGLVPAGATAADFPGMMTNRCGAGSGMERRAVEAYARRYTRPSQIYHDLSGTGLTPSQANAALTATLDRSGAYQTLATRAASPH
jgi:hypothetical protein